MATHDVIVIGGGVNGLVSASVLAGAGRDVLVVERSAALGGIAASLEFHPGCRTTGLLHDTSGLRDAVVASCDLESHGLLRVPEAAVLFAEPGERGLLVGPDPTPTAAEIRERSPVDAEAYARWCSFLAKAGGALAPLLDRPAPALDGSLRSLAWQALPVGRTLRKLGRRELTEVLRIPSMCVADWLKEWFKDDLLQAGLAAPALLGTCAGPWSAGTAANLLFDSPFRRDEVQGGPAALVEALATSCTSRGVTLRTESTVERIVLRGDRISGVELQNGTQHEAGIVISSADPRHTFHDLVPRRHLPPDLDAAISSWRTRSTLAKVHLALDGPLKVPGREQPIERLRTGSSLDSLERAFDASKYGRFSDPPLLDVRDVTHHAPTGPRPEHRVVSILVHFAPNDLSDGWTAQTRDALGRLVLEELTRHCPTAGDRIIAQQILAPPDLADLYALPDGHPFHGEHALDQLLSLRPTASCARYQTPIPGLWLCGSGVHPGGFSPGMAGLLAAQAILR